MSVAIPKSLAILVALGCLAPLATTGAHAKRPKKSERAMTKSKGAKPMKSERAMPDAGQPAGTPPAAAERAMPAPDKM